MFTLLKVDMSYDLLEKAPKDHHSEEFLQFLRENNEVVEESVWWLVIKNCKYHNKNRRWFTAFWKPGAEGTDPKGWMPFQALSFLQTEFSDLNWLIKAPKDRSVERFHVHLYE